jgi:hypothetical protein
MSSRRKIDRWRRMDEISAKALTAHTQAPESVFPVPLSALPLGLLKMSGLVSAYASHYATTQPTLSGISAIGELAAVRTEGHLGKAYNHVFGVSSDGNVYSNGPRIDFPAHHFQSSQPVPVASLFIGHPTERKA